MRRELEFLTLGVRYSNAGYHHEHVSEHSNLGGKGHRPPIPVRTGAL
jgi:hypothetical protein